MKQRLAVFVGGLAVLFAATALFMKSRQSEILVASEAVLKPEWTELRPKAAMQTTGDWSELFIEIPGLHTQRAGEPLLAEKEQEILVEGYLLARSGEKIKLDVVNIVAFGNKTAPVV